MDSFRQHKMTLTKGTIAVQKTSANAILPDKEDPTQIGHDITLVSKLNKNVEVGQGELVYYCTDLKLSPPANYHIEMVATDGLIKSGYMLANSPLVIDPNESEDIKVPLLKVNSGPELELPFKGLRMLLRESNHTQVSLIKADQEEKYHTSLVFKPGSKNTATRTNHFS